MRNAVEFERFRNPFARTHSGTIACRMWRAINFLVPVPIRMGRKRKSCWNVPMLRDNKLRKQRWLGERFQHFREPVW